MIHVIAFALPPAPSSPAIGEEQQLTTAEIKAMRPEVVAKTSNTRQVFSADGATDCNASGRSSSGSWRSVNDQYCSTWSAAGPWTCHDVLKDGDTLVWSDARGQRTINTIEPK